MRRAMRDFILLICLLIGIAGMGSASAAPDPAAGSSVKGNFDITDLRTRLFDPKGSDVLIISHRGDWHGAAENSLRSIEKAIEKGCAGVVVDVRRTKDGTLVLMADKTVDRMTDGKGLVSRLTLAEIRSLHLRDSKGELTAFRVPTLEEALLLAKGRIMIAVSSYDDYASGIGALVQKTGTAREFFRLSEIPRKTAYTWREQFEQAGPGSGANQSGRYAELMKEGYTVFVSDAPKAINSFLGRTHIRAVIAVSGVFGDGQKVAYAVLRYGDAIDGSSVGKDTFAAEEHTVTDAFTSGTEDPSGRADSGRQVIVTFDTSVRFDAAAGGAGKKETKDEKEHAIPQIRAGNRPERKEGLFPGDVTLRQLRPVRTTDGREINEAFSIRSTMEKTLVVDDFRQEVFRDPETGGTLRYNIFIPKGYTEKEKYPLVLFMHDASGAGQEDTWTLRQGLGAVIWASPREQAKHPAIVLAPQYDEVVTDDSYAHTASAELTAELVRHIMRTYTVDSSRVYVTGQSMGCMMAYFLMSHYPDFFTAGLLVAGHWNTAELAPMSRMPLWLVSGGGKSQSGAEGAIRVWEAHGGEASSAEWPLSASDRDRDDMTSALIARGGNIHYSHLTGGSHFDTWRAAYGFGAVRDWLFRQRK